MPVRCVGTHPLSGEWRVAVREAGVQAFRPARPLVVVLLAAALAVSPAPAAAQDPPEVDAVTPRRVTARASVDWLSAVRGTGAADGLLNPGNARLRLPEFGGQVELRGNLRVEFGSRLQLVVRPRAIGTADASWGDGLPREDNSEAEAHFTEAYLAWSPASALTVTYGLQNFQWGPAELIAPNNRIFHETGIFRDSLYYVRGRHLLRVNLSPGRQWSIVALAELGANGDDAFRAGERFERQGLVKAEFTTADGASYAGGTVGVTRGIDPWFGGYGMLGLTEGLSVYVDTSHTRGSQAWYPVAVGPRLETSSWDPASAGFPSGALPLSSMPVLNPPQVAFARPFADDDQWRSMVAAGGRYTFARGDDLRVEYLFQQAGWRESDFLRGFEAARFALSEEAFAPYVRPGLEFLGRQFLLLSLRTPELPPRKRLEVQTRYLHAFTDTSRLLFLTGRFEATDRLVLFVSGTVTGGPEHGEFSRLVRSSVVGGTSVTW